MGQEKLLDLLNNIVNKAEIPIEQHTEIHNIDSEKEEVLMV